MDSDSVATYRTMHTLGLSHSEVELLCKKEIFQTFKLPSLGLKDVLVIPRSENKEVSMVIFIKYPAS